RTPPQRPGASPRYTPPLTCHFTPQGQDENGSVTDPSLSALRHELDVPSHLRGRRIDGLHLGVGEFVFAQVAGVQQRVNLSLLEEDKVKEVSEISAAFPLRHQ
ncbi:hypothetical protein, partial [Streptomyces sp. NPDC012825]|uniref:hypothetical protein n=1 Tax=Streptomyces sp. NPDC012825 TaxID=3364851 RepID=UPI0036C6D34B